MFGGVERPVYQNDDEGVFRLAKRRGCVGDVTLRMRSDFDIRPGNWPWERIEAEALKTWEHFIPGNLFPETEPTQEEIAAIKWSDLVPSSLVNQEKITHLVEKAWAVENGVEVIGVAGTMGTGKSVFSRALQGGRPLESFCLPEEWEDNRDLAPFYRLLADCTDPGCRQSDSYPEIVALLRRVQGRAQGWFAARKFSQDLMIMGGEPVGTFIRDTPLGQDGVYFMAQAGMGLADEESVGKYLADNDSRQRLLPSSLRKPLALVLVWAPFEVVRERVLVERGRDFEDKVPEDYLFNLQRDTIQWALAMEKAGVPVLVVDASGNDFRAGGIDRQQIVAKTWAEIDKIRGEQQK